MRTELHTQRSKFDRALGLIETLSTALRLSAADRVALERQLLAAMPTDDRVDEHRAPLDLVRC